MVVGMIYSHSRIQTPATRFLPADIPLFNNVHSPKRRLIAFASASLVAHPQSTLRTSCIYVFEELASTARSAISMPTVPDSSVQACMTLSCAFLAMPAVAALWNMACKPVRPSCHLRETRIHRP